MMADVGVPDRDGQSLFRRPFKLLTGHMPFPWQEGLFTRFAAGDIPLRCTLSTGLGKTNVIAIWLIALARGARLPRRLAYVVNRRTVVDQTTLEVERIRNNIQRADVIRDSLAEM